LPGMKRLVKVVQVLGHLARGEDEVWGKRIC
jgi:hypothetical protein